MKREPQLAIEITMIVFDVFLNDRQVCRAGVGEHGVVSAIVGHSAAVAQDGGARREYLDLRVGGMRPEEDEPREWANILLTPGDTIVIDIGEADEADAPTPSSAAVLP